QLAITPDISIQAPPQRPNHLELGTHLNRGGNINNNTNHKSSMVKRWGKVSDITDTIIQNEVQKLKEQLEQQALQTRQALAQLIMVREQLISETNARMEAQARTQQLLQQNRELLEHLASLGAYTEPQQQSLTAANIAMAPQSHLSMLLDNQAKNMMSNNNLASINQQINNLGSINQQLTNLSHQLNGINQQQQGFQNYSAQNQTPNNNGNQPTMNQLQNISNQLSSISVQNNQEALNKELYQMNQDLLNRLQSMNLGMNHLTAATPNNNSLFFANPMSCSPNTNTNMNFLSTPSSYGNLTPSPVGTLNRNSFSQSHSPLPMINSTDGLGLSIDKNLNNLEDNAHIMKSRLGMMGGGVVNQSNNNISDSTRSDSSSSPLKLSDQRLNNIANNGNTVMLKVTDEAGNVTNTRKLSATPSFIQRSTAKKCQIVVRS
uniref:Capon-like protein n=1 Tax=Megaselia scalaris TaxID=36166 RepID=T1GWP9_MEGSC